MISQMTPPGVRPARRAEIDRAFGLPGAHEDAAVTRAKREDVAGGDELVGAAARIRGDADGVRAIGGADAGGHAHARLDAHRERGAERGAGASGEAIIGRLSRAI